MVQGLPLDLTVNFITFVLRRRISSTSDLKITSKVNTANILEILTITKLNKKPIDFNFGTEPILYGHVNVKDALIIVNCDDYLFSRYFCLHCLKTTINLFEKKNEKMFRDFKWAYQHAHIASSTLRAKCVMYACIEEYPVKLSLRNSLS